MWTREEIRAEHQRKEDSARELAEAERAVIEAARELLRISRHYRLDSTEGKVAAAKVIQAAGALDALEE
jgi:hypothetical protein